MSRILLNVAIVVISIAVAATVASYLYFRATTAGQGFFGGMPPPEAFAFFHIWIVASLTCVPAVPYAVIALRKNKDWRRLSNLLAVGSGALLLLSTAASVGFAML